MHVLPVVARSLAATFSLATVMTPNPGKAADGLEHLAKETQENEPGCLRYLVFEQLSSNSTNDFVVLEEYRNETAFEHHISTDYFKAFIAFVQNGNLSAQNVNVLDISKIAGFVRH